LIPGSSLHSAGAVVFVHRHNAPGTAPRSQRIAPPPKNITHPKDHIHQGQEEEGGVDEAQRAADHQEGGHLKEKYLI
jgi:hypothetical protein